MIIKMTQTNHPMFFLTNMFSSLVTAIDFSNTILYTTSITELETTVEMLVDELNLSNKVDTKEVAKLIFEIKNDVKLIKGFSETTQKTLVNKNECGAKIKSIEQAMKKYEVTKKHLESEKTKILAKFNELATRWKKEENTDEQKKDIEMRIEGLIKKLATIFVKLNRELKQNNKNAKELEDQKEKLAELYELDNFYNKLWTVVEKKKKAVEEKEALLLQTLNLTEEQLNQIDRFIRV